MTNKKYWQNFYKKFKILTPSPFALWIHKKLNFDKYQNRIIEFGTGTGRDGYYFAKNNQRVLGVDFASNLKESTNFIFVKSELVDFLESHSPIFYDIVYSRFFLHSIPKEQILSLLDWTSSLFVAEFRVKEDVPLLYKNHYRNLIDSDWFLNEMIKRNFKILYFEKSNNWAQYKNENPILVRVIGQKK